MLFDFGRIVATARSMIANQSETDDHDLKIAVMIAIQQNFPRSLSGTLHDAQQIHFPNIQDENVKKVQDQSHFIIIKYTILTR